MLPKPPSQPNMASDLSTDENNLLHLVKIGQMVWINAHADISTFCFIYDCPLLTVPCY